MLLSKPSNMENWTTLEIIGAVAAWIIIMYLGFKIRDAAKDNWNKFR